MGIWSIKKSMDRQKTEEGDEEGKKGKKEVRKGLVGLKRKGTMAKKS